MSEIGKKIGLKIKFERMKKGLTQEKLAELTGLHVSTIKDTENNLKSPTVRTLEQIAKGLSIDFVDLVDVSKFEL